VSRFAPLQELIARRDPALALHGLSAVLIVVLAVQVVRIGWAAAAPVGPIGAAAPAPARAPAAADFALLDRFDPFFRTASATPAAGGADSANLRLFGVRTGARSSAIIGRSDGRQVSVVVGEEVAPGILLRTVAADHVELRVQGRRARLAFPPPAAGAASYTPPPMVQPAVTSPAAGATVSPAAAGAAELARAGLQPGDVVISVNGQSVSDTQSVEALGRDLAGGREAVVQYQRDGQVRTATLRIPEL
jgi:general secretion pathway protein C